MGQKLTLGFGLLLVMMTLFGGMVMSVMREVGRDASRVARVDVPTVAVANEVAGEAMMMIAEARGYAANYEEAILVQARRHQDQALQAVERGRKELEKTGSSRESLSPLDEIKKMLIEYGRDLEKTSVTVGRLTADEDAASAATDRIRETFAEIVNAEAEALLAARNQAQGTTSPEVVMHQNRLTSYSQAAYQFERSRALVNRALLRHSPEQIREQLPQLEKLETLMAALPQVPAAVVEAARDHTDQMRDLADVLEALQDINSSRLSLGDQIMAAVSELARSGVDGARSATESGAERLENASERLLAGLVLLVLLSVGFAVILTRSITQPLRRAVEFSRGVTEGDFTQTLPIEQRDEIGDLAHALNTTIAGLRDQTMAITEGVNVLASTVGEIATSTSELAANSTEVAASISETTATVEEVRQTSFISNEKAQQVSDISQQVAQAAQTGGRAAEAMVQEMGRIREQMQVIASSIAKLNEQSRTIGDIISTVDDLAEQSNILAVNAAIEAARAGEAGRGFAVVAQEIRALAEQSKRATGQVRGILNEIQRSTGDAVATVEQGTRVVEAGQHQSAAAGEAIRTLIQGINEASEASTQIAAMSRQQMAGVDQVAVAMENIKQASSQTADSMRQLEEAAQNLSALGQRLKELVGRFRA